MEKKYILAIDQGTTSCRAIIFDKDAKVINKAQSETSQIYPKPGWVEQDPMEIWGLQSGVIGTVLETAAIRSNEVAAIGVTNQRETTIVWDKNTGKPIYNAIVWQCKRTSQMIDKIIEEGHGEYIKEKTGLIADAYFSASKIKWILDNVEGAREKAERGELLFGTIDTWIIYNLTRGKVHVTDYSNASRTMLMDIKTLDWDDKLLEIFDVPRSMLPEIKSSSEIYGYTDSQSNISNIAISGIGGDQQASLFGHKCHYPGMAKNTYGTGCFMLMNTGEKAIKSKNGLLTTIAWGIDGKVEYALEGSIFVAGALIQWLRDELRLIGEAADSEYFATKVEDNGGVYIIPAFVGLGAPYWDMDARASIMGITRGSNRNHIIRAALEAIAYQTKDVLRAMEEDSQIRLKILNVDGGASMNDFLMNFQADILDTLVKRPKQIETTALGAAFLAGLAVGFWDSIEDLPEAKEDADIFRPNMEAEKRDKLYKEWKLALEKTLTNKN